jgi:hypothetical protein
MLKSIFKQLWNRKRSNTWVFLELLLVFCLVWYTVNYFFGVAFNYSLPDGRNTDHTWQVALAEYPSVHTSYRPEENTGEAREANYARILRTIRNYPGVEAVSVSFNDAAPGSGSYMGASLTHPSDSTLSCGGQQIMIDPQEDFFRVFDYTADNGQKAVSCKDFDWTMPNPVVIGRSVAEHLFPGGSAVGREVLGWGKGHMTVIGVVDDIKRFGYSRPQYALYGITRLDSTSLRNSEISIRSRASISDARFREMFVKEMTDALQVGNFYLRGLTSYAKIAHNTATMFGVTNQIRTQMYLMIFFLLNVLLCVMGTFWYRIHTRRDEIGLRKALGSGKAGVRNMLLVEGLCLLTVAALPAMLLEYQFVRAGLLEGILTGKGANISSKVYLPDRVLLRFLITNGINWLVMAVVIVGAIWLPARKAAAMQPAEALHYE